MQEVLLDGPLQRRLEQGSHLPLPPHQILLRIQHPLFYGVRKLTNPQLTWSPLLKQVPPQLTCFLVQIFEACNSPYGRELSQ